MGSHTWTHHSTPTSSTLWSSFRIPDRARTRLTESTGSEEYGGHARSGWAVIRIPIKKHANSLYHLRSPLPYELILCDTTITGRELTPRISRLQSKSRESRSRQHSLGQPLRTRRNYHHDTVRHASGPIPQIPASPQESARGLSST